MLEGRVRVNGQVVTELGTRVDPERDSVELDGRPVTLPDPRWIVFHKPPGVLTTRRDPHGGKTVYDVLPDEMRGLRYVGRLDLETEGLLILTNEGDAVHGLLHPSGEVEREYRATVKGTAGSDVMRRLERGVVLDDGPARAVRARVVERGGNRTVVGLVLTEGRKREVRRLLEAVGHPVVRLVRMRFGPLKLESLAPGAWRELNDDERLGLLAAAGVRARADKSEDDGSP